VITLAKPAHQLDGSDAALIRRLLTDEYNRLAAMPDAGGVTIRAVQVRDLAQVFLADRTEARFVITRTV
jgi:hypothetical protein